jgi:ribosomal protein S8
VDSDLSTTAQLFDICEQLHNAIEELIDTQTTAAQALTEIGNNVQIPNTTKNVPLSQVVDAIIDCLQESYIPEASHQEQQQLQRMIKLVNQ